MDGFANTSLLLSQTNLKVGPFLNPVAVKNNFHVVSDDPTKIAFLRAGAFCDSCHDVRVPLYPRDYSYEIQLPTQQQLQALGVTLQGPLHVHAQVNFEHFPPLFLRFLAGATGPNRPTGLFSTFNEEEGL